MNRLLYTIVNNGINLLQIIILVRVVMSWIPHNPHNQWTRLLYQVTEPILKPIRDILPGQSMGFDFSPVVVFLTAGIVEKGAGIGPLILQGRGHKFKSCSTQ